MSNIVLIGMPGVGKSTIGVVLAKAMGYRFIDSDIIIQNQYNKMLSQLIEEKGDAGFIQLENDVNRNINVNRCVIATGGSAVYGREAMQHFKENGVVIYLKAPFEVIEGRIGSLKNRGVVSNGKTGIRDIFNDRSRLYEQYADVIIEEHNETIREMVSKILACKEVRNII